MKLFLLMNGGHSPKGKMVQDLTIAFASYDLERIKPYLLEDITWTLVGDQPIKGKGNFLSALESMKENEVEELQIHQILTHGKEAAVHGDMLMENGDRFGFGDFYLFANDGTDRIQSITSYVVKK